ncbi:hypothetical protein U1Q18_006039 [Sarracenia purpurea var. burkii]
MENQKFTQGNQSGNKAESTSTEHGSMEGSPRQMSRNAGGKNLTSVTGNPPDSKSRPNVERLGHTNTQKETKSTSTINIPKECVSAKRVLTSTNTNLSRDWVGTERNLGLGGKGVDGGAATQNSNPVEVNPTQALQNPVHDTEETLAIKAQSWRISSPATSNGEKKKWKAANEGGREVDVEVEQAFVRKKSRIGMHKGGMLRTFTHGEGLVEAVGG